MTMDGPASRYGTQQLICGVVAAMPVLYMAVIAVLKSAGVLPADGLGSLEPAVANTISMAMVGAGVLSSSISIVLKKALLAGQARGGTEDSETRFKGTLVAMAVAESGAVMGLVLMLLTGNLLFGGLLCGLSFAICCFHFPSRYWLEHGSVLR